MQIPKFDISKVSTEEARKAYEILKAILLEYNDSFGLSEDFPGAVDSEYIAEVIADIDSPETEEEILEWGTVEKDTPGWYTNKIERLLYGGVTPYPGGITYRRGSYNYES